jgi:hypothetical protein
MKERSSEEMKKPDEYVEDSLTDVLRQGPRDLLAQAVVDEGTVFLATHAFFILGGGSDRKGHKLVAGAKVFSYLKARGPIIGVLPNDETKKVLENVGVSTIADVDSLPEIVTAIRRVLDAWLKGTLAALLPDRVACDRYSAENQTASLIRALEGDIAEMPFHSGFVKVPMSLAGEIGL